MKTNNVTEMFTCLQVLNYIIYLDILTLIFLENVEKNSV